MSRPSFLVHPSTARFRKVAGTADRWIRVHETCAYRAASPRWAQNDRLLDGEGSRRQGGRWSAPGIRAAYLCESPEVSLSEYLAGTRGAGIPDRSGLPAVVAWGEVRLQRVLDLTSAEACAALGLDLEALLAAPWRQENEAGRESEPQSLGGAARAAGIEALRTPSAAVAGAVNLVVFVDRLLPGSLLESHGLTTDDR